MATPRQCEIVRDLFETCFDRVYGFVRKTADPETAEEVTQDVFARLLFVQDFESKEISVSYLIKIADNLLKRRFRRQERWTRIGEDLGREQTLDQGAKAACQNPEAGDARVTAAMDRLSHDERAAVRLIVCEGLSYEDAARSLGVEVSTINNWKHRGIQKLKQHVGAERSAGSRDDAAGCAGSGISALERRGRARQRTVQERPSGRYRGCPEND
jgi:RNA polymerase sigma-70 factor (ECF subfamily)